MTKETPDFGGVRIEKGELTVFVRDEASLEPARFVTAKIFEGSAPPTVALRPASGGASEAVKNQAADALTVPGTTMLDFDERTSYVRIAEFSGYEQG